MKNFVIPCYSNVPDRDHNAVVLSVDAGLLELLGERLDRFAMDASADHGLLEDVYNADNVGLYYAHSHDDPNETLDYVDAPTELSKHQDDVDVGVVVLTPVQNARLHISRGGFWFEWDGLQNRHGPSEVYETQPAELIDITPEDVSPTWRETQ